MDHMVSRKAAAQRMAEYLRRMRVVGRAFVVGFQQLQFVLLGEPGHGGHACKVEQRRAEAAIFPVDQPDPLAVVDEVGRQEVVVAEHQIDHADLAFEGFGDRHVAVKVARLRLLPSRMTWA